MGIKKLHSWSISIKLWLAMTLLILAVLGGLGIAITWLFGDFYLQQKLDSLESEAKEISAQLADAPSWNERIFLLQSLRLSTGTQLVLLDTQGNILVITGSTTANGTRPGIEWPLGGLDQSTSIARPRSLRPSDFFLEDDLSKVLAGQTIKHMSLPIDSSGQRMILAATSIGSKNVTGVVLLGSSPTPLLESIAAFRGLIFYVSLIAVSLATLVSLFFARLVTRPLALMQLGATRMAKGNFMPIKGVTSRDEIGQLAESLNSMGESLKNHMDWLSQEKDLLQGIIESISDAVIMIGIDGSILYANDTAKAMWQETEGEQNDRKVQIVGFLHSMAQSNGTGENYSTMTIGIQVLHVVMAPMSEIEGIQGHVAVLSDVTATLRAEKCRREFLASVTHELRTPLHLIQGYLEAINDGVIPNNQQNEYIELILEEAKRLGRLVHELQDINRLEREQVLQRVSIDLEIFLNDINQRFQGRAHELELSFEVEKGSGELLADPDRLLQVFINLLDNAMVHTPQGKSVRVLFEEEETVVRFAVQDEGEGIPKEALTHIFDRFFRVNKARSRNDGGMGLGLSIVRQIVEAHGGSVSVESSIGHGSTFWVEIPKKLT